ncbi:DUF6341 family protein [Flavobacterium luminosum]|uniref:Uracil phosphoribosyltransferase n=1 Tax=Flavobacterium luminosum TaxID=2949086 RepID=A0ABT0TR02_9FLAO|nr:uracil phosphoribosyltransferase [Flavobacterium sp. HXWNR70]MCL9809922.1 uracil phosphoribosyltransferase [Flavobacterium sp. HXWNR70]
MKSFFEAIAWLFEEILMAPHDLMRSLELDNWWIANLINWVLWGIICYYIVYWVKQLQIFKDNNEDDQDTTAHSFLK